MALCNEGVDPTGEGKREGKGEGEGHCPAIAFPFISIQFLSCPFISFHLLSFLYPPGNDHISHLGKLGKSSTQIKSADW